MNDDERSKDDAGERPRRGADATGSTRHQRHSPLEPSHPLERSYNSPSMAFSDARRVEVRVLVTRGLRDKRGQRRTFRLITAMVGAELDDDWRSHRPAQERDDRAAVSHLALEALPRETRVSRPSASTPQKAIGALVEDELVEREERGFRVAEPFLAQWILDNDV